LPTPTPTVADRWSFASPGIGDTRAQYRFPTPLPVGAAYSAIAIEPRGLGKSSAGFDDYAAAAVGSDVATLIQHTRVEQACLMGNYAAAAAIWVAAEIPTQVQGIVLLDPAVYDAPLPFLTKITLDLAAQRPWGPAFWSMYYGSLYKAGPAADLAQYRAALQTNLKEPDRFEAFKASLYAPKAPPEAGIAEVHAPPFVIMGTGAQTLTIQPRKRTWSRANCTAGWRWSLA